MQPTFQMWDEDDKLAPRSSYTRAIFARFASETCKGQRSPPMGTGVPCAIPLARQPLVEKLRDPFGVANAIAALTHGKPYDIPSVTKETHIRKHSHTMVIRSAPFRPVGLADLESGNAPVRPCIHWNISQSTQSRGIFARQADNRYDQDQRSGKVGK